MKYRPLRASGDDEDRIIMNYVIKIKQFTSLCYHFVSFNVIN